MKTETQIKVKITELENKLEDHRRPNQDWVKSIQNQIIALQWVLQ